MFSPRSQIQIPNQTKITVLAMHAYCDALISPPTTKSHISLLPPLAGGGGAASICPSSRVSFIRSVPNRTRFSCIRAASNGSVRSDMSFYELLGVPETGTLPEIKQAYKQLARKYHPDVSSPERVKEYTQRFIQVQEAYETLSDPWRRALYDSDMAKGLHLPFSSRNIHLYNKETMDDKSDWRNRWESQLSELKRRSMYKEAGGNSSWGARMRRQKNESPADD